VVKGTLKLSNGKMLNHGRVHFYTNDENYFGSAFIDAKGAYEMKDAPLGDVVVAIIVEVPSGGLGGMPSGVKLPPGGRMPKGKAPEGSKTEAVPVDPGKIVRVPDKYAKRETSPLRYTVTSGEQTKDFVLEP